MAILGASFQIGRSALAAYQAAISVTGQNIANLANPDYARQTERLAALHGGMTLAGIAPGTGVEITGLQRHVDNALEARLRLALGSRDGALVTYNNYSRIEALYNELTEVDLSTQLSEFFGTFTNVQSDPLEPTARDLVIGHAEKVIATLQRHRTGLLQQLTDLNRTADDLALTANGIAGEIADLNELIMSQDATGAGGANALRDRRDALLRDLSQLMDIQTREYGNGVVNVYVGSEPLVEGARSRGIKSETTLENGTEIAVIRFADTHGRVIMHTGQLAATVAARDDIVAGRLAELDQFTRALIYEVNRVHSTGRGLVGYTSLTGSYAVNDANAALNGTAAALTFPVQNGTFLVKVRDQASGQTLTRMIEVDLDGIGGDTTLNDLVRALDAVPGLNAALTADNRLQLDTDTGFEVDFADDSSGALAALGVATFFTGIDANTIAVRDEIRQNSRLIAASLSGMAGDGSNAGRLGKVGAAASNLLGGRSLIEFQQAITHQLAVDVSNAETEHVAADAVYSSLLTQREALSGVSLDEEAINLTKFERSFQGASRFLSVVDSLSAEILALVGT